MERRGETVLVEKQGGSRREVLDKVKVSTGDMDKVAPCASMSGSSCRVKSDEDNVRGQGEGEKVGKSKRS